MYKLIPSLAAKSTFSLTWLRPIGSIGSILLKIAVVKTALLAAAPASATEFECSSDQETRLIRVDYPGFEHLCEVSVTKEDESREVKWYADSDSSFCSVKISGASAVRSGRTTTALMSSPLVSANTLTSW